MSFKNIETKIIHSGEPSPRIQDAVAMPIFQSAMFLTEGGDYHGLKYIRLNNTPNHDALHAKLAALENAEAALVMASGMAAISTTLLTVLTKGDHLLAQNCLYGGTHDLVTHDFAGWGLSHDFIDARDPSSWESKLRPETKAIYVEAITNPLMEVGDLKAVVEFAKAHGLISMIDNTFTSPMNFRPAEWGYDLSLHSGTKYLNGHNDIVAGAVIGRADLVEQIRLKLNHLGGSLDPHACYLLHRGMKTLAVRVRHQNHSALEMARFLDGHAAVKTVNYSGLESNQDHARAREFFEGSSGMLSFELSGGADAATQLLHQAQIPLIAPSLGGVDSLLTIPARTSHQGMTRADREAVGISEGLIRMSVGLESTEDLIADLNNALS